jgi:histidine triad (HIT) family protein
MYNHAPENYICPFCLIVQGIENEHVYSVQTDIIYQNQWITAVISSHQWPNNAGNVVIIPNEHYGNIYDLPVHYASKIHAVAKAVALAMKLVFACDGVSTRQHNEPAGNQDAWHYHLHITPRYEGDRFYTTHRQLMPVSERTQYAQKLREYLVNTR